MNAHYEIGKQVVKTLTDAGHIAYFAGGWVRDHIMEADSDDIDIATTASVDTVQSLFDKTIPVGVAFGICIVVLEGHQFEVATFRKDRGYKDGRRPTGIDPATPKEDAKRRDFTINGMFFDPHTNEIFDYVQGKKDIEAKIIRAIGNPHERFLEDRLRMIRAIRYASRFHFTIEENTLNAILDHADQLFPAVAIERVWHEFQKMDKFPHLEKALITLHTLNLLPTIFPDLTDTPLSEITSRLNLLPSYPKDTPLIHKILQLFPLDSLKKKLALCEHLKLPNQDKAFVLYFDLLNAALPQTKEDADWAHLYADSLFPLSLSILSLTHPQDLITAHQDRNTRLRPHIERIQNKTPLVRASHLKIKPGPAMGALLAKAERLAINLDLQSPEAVLQHLQSPDAS